MAGLSPDDVASVMETLSAGKRPRVVFTEAAGQIAGKTGKVVRLEEPAEGDFVVVAFGNDELPFTVEEVRLPERGELGRKAKAKKEEPTAPAGPAGPPLLEEKDDRAASVVEKEFKTVSDEVEVPKQAAAAGGAKSEGKEAAARKRQSKPKPSAELTVTLTCKEGEWTVSAAKGSKVIAKPVPVKPAAAVGMVQSLDSPGVAQVVEDIVEQQRSEAAAEADRLRQQLAEAEARLAELA